VGILEKLAGGDRRSIGRVPEVVRQVLKEPGLVADLLAGLGHEDPVVRMRAGDALEKISRRHPEWLRSSRDLLLDLASATKEQETRWHLAQMLPRLDLAPAQRRALSNVLDGYLTDMSAIVRVSALQALADLAALDQGLCRRALARVRAGLLRGGPAVRARARMLLPALEGRPVRAPESGKRGQRSSRRRNPSRAPRR
jgi:hypothetical protein